jgi:hypothetical protein
MDGSLPTRFRKNTKNKLKNFTMLARNSKRVFHFRFYRTICNVCIACTDVKALFACHFLNGFCGFALVGLSFFLWNMQNLMVNKFVVACRHMFVGGEINRVSPQIVEERWQPLVSSITFYCIVSRRSGIYHHVAAIAKQTHYFVIIIFMLTIYIVQHIHTIFTSLHDPWRSFRNKSSIKYLPKDKIMINASLTKQITA